MASQPSHVGHRLNLVVAIQTVRIKHAASGNILYRFSSSRRSLLRRTRKQFELEFELPLPFPSRRAATPSFSKLTSTLAHLSLYWLTGIGTPLRGVFKAARLGLDDVAGKLREQNAMKEKKMKERMEEMMKRRKKIDDGGSECRPCAGRRSPVSRCLFPCLLPPPPNLFACFKGFTLFLFVVLWCSITRMSLRRIVGFLGVRCPVLCVRCLYMPCVPCALCACVTVCSRRQSACASIPPITLGHSRNMYIYIILQAFISFSNSLFIVSWPRLFPHLS